MYPVSREFQEAIRKPDRITRLHGSLSLKDIKGSVTFEDDAVVQGSLVIVDQMTGGKFGYGSAYSRNMSVKLDRRKLKKHNSDDDQDIDIVNLNLTNATIALRFYLTLETGTEEEVFLGWYMIDSTKSSRKFDVISIIAVSPLFTMNYPVTPVENVSLYEAVKSACSETKRIPLTTQEEFEALPNGNITISNDGRQAETALDLVMWAASLTGTIVRSNRLPGDPYSVEFVQTPTKYTVGGTAGNFNLEEFKADNGTIISADVRFSTDYTDTSIRNTTVLMNRKGKQFSSHRDWNFAPDTLEGTIELESNPLLEGKTNSEVQSVIDNLQDYTDDLRFCPFKTTFNGNPAIEIGDFVYLEPGGAVDDTQFRHYGIVTYSKWVYRGKCEIRCAADMAAERPDTASVLSINRMAKAAPRAASDVFGVQPKSQIEKKIDALSGAGDASALIFKPAPELGRLKFKSPYDLSVTCGNEEIYNIYGNTGTNNTRFFKLNVINTADVVIDNSKLEINWENGARLLLSVGSGAVFFEGSETSPTTNRKYNWEINPYEGEIRINGKKVTL